MFAGLADGNYASDYWYDFAKHPWLVDFDLLKIHPLECDFGMGSLSMFSHPSTVEERDFICRECPMDATVSSIRSSPRRSLSGVSVDLPPYGWRCWTDDGRVISLSDDEKYYAKSEDYEYIEFKSAAAHLSIRTIRARRRCMKRHTAELRNIIPVRL